jgi:soluble lytic murein transglycosylase
MTKGCFPRRSIGALVIFGLVASAGSGIEGRPAGQNAVVAPPSPAALAAPARPAVPTDLARFWLVPSSKPPASLARPAAELAAALDHLSESNPEKALPTLSALARARSPLAPYAAYYRGLCLLALSRADEARKVFAGLHVSADPSSFVGEASIGHEAEAAAASGDHAAAARLYDELLARKPASPETVLLALGTELLAAGDRPRAAEAFSRVYYDFPASDAATEAGAKLDKLQDVRPAADARSRARLDLSRAEQLFAAKRYPAAKDAFSALAASATGDEADLVALRLAECDEFLNRHRSARDALRPLVDRGARKTEARFFFLTATRGLGDKDDYVRLAREFIDANPGSSWADEALNNLATHYILEDEDEQADAVFRELYAKFPRGPHAERAAWRAGWWAYAHGRPADAIAFFEGAAAAFPRSDYRPAYLYWAARSRERLGDTAGAVTVYRLLVADYENSYYGRLAATRPAVTAASAKGSSAPSAPTPPVEPPPLVGAAPAAAVDAIRLLVSLGLYQPARDELLYAQRTWGDSPAVSATLGFVYNKLGDYRRGILAMKRAYPQYIGQAGARMPVEALKVIFPLEYWPLITKYAAAYRLDPFLIAALINQESAFDRKIKSSAGAIGLMQILPSTGRLYARKLHIRRFSTMSLISPEINIRIGVAYFADVVSRAGGVHLALAGYNAGERRVTEWNAERTDHETDEYIDSIPFPETQNYVKRILGTMEDYRRLYGAGQGQGR